MLFVSKSLTYVVHSSLNLFYHNFPKILIFIVFLNNLHSRCFIVDEDSEQHSFIVSPTQMCLSRYYCLHSDPTHRQRVTNRIQRNMLITLGSEVWLVRLDFIENKLKFRVNLTIKCTMKAFLRLHRRTCCYLFCFKTKNTTISLEFSKYKMYTHKRFT